MVYFDNAATTKVFKEAAEAAVSCMLSCYSNPSSLHDFGSDAEDILNNARKTIASIFNSSEQEIIFTSCATESNNIAILGSSKKQKNKKKILTSKIEHASVERCMQELERKGFEIVRVNPKKNEYFAEDFEKEVDENTFLVSVMHVNNENGLILPIKEISEKVKNKNKNVLIHVDASQSFCKLPIDVKQLNLDFVSASGHKINAPKGIGVLYVKNKNKLAPLTFGGMQESGLKPGTENLPAIAALNVAAKINYKKMQNNIKKFSHLKAILIDILKKNENILFNFTENSVPYIVNISVANIKSETMVHFLEKNGFIASSKSACSKTKKSNILQNLGYRADRAQSAIRISFSCDSIARQVENLANLILNGSFSIAKFN